MFWFVFALVSLLGWGTADLFYKISSDETDRYSHLKIAVWVGIVMGVCSVALMPFAESKLTASTLFVNAIKYLPASFCYIASMIIGYAGLRYLELSIVSPVQNASGAFSGLCILIFFIVSGRTASIADELSVIEIIGIVLTVLGVILLAVTEKKLSDEPLQDKKYRFGVLALIFPLLYCVFDTIGTAADGIILDDTVGLGLGEIDVIILYGLTFFVVGIAAWLFLAIKCRKVYNPFKKQEMPKLAAACCEEFGQVFYVFAMAANPIVTAPMVASYCIVSLILSRIFIGEKLSRSQLFCIVCVILGIVLLGISDGISAL